MKKFTFLFCALMLCLSARANYYIVGDFNGWNVANAIELTTTDGTNYTVQLDTLWGGFKITTARDWNHGDYGASSGSNLFSVGQTMSLVSKANGNNYNVNISGGYSNAVLSFAITNNTPQLTFISGTIQNTSNYSPYYIVGDFNNWNAATAVEMTTTDGENYTVQLDTLLGGFKIISARDWNHTVYGAYYSGNLLSVGQTINLEDESYTSRYNINVAGCYVNALLSLNTIYSDPELTLVSGIGTYYIVGDFNNWNAATAVEMTTTDGVHYYVHLDTLYGGFKITSTRDWDHLNWGARDSINSFSYIYNGYDRYFGELKTNENWEEDPNYNILTDMGYSDVTLRLYVNYSNRYLSYESVAPFVGYSFVDNNIEYQITSQNPYTVAITGNSISTYTDLVIPNEVTFYGQNYAVTSIKHFAFYDDSYSYIKSVVIGNNVKTIEYGAFYNCDNLKSVTWNAIRCKTVYSSNYGPFQDCNNITSFVLGNNVQRIPDYLCSYMTGVTSITIPNSVTSIGRGAFYGCGNAFTSLVINENVDTIGPDAFGGCDNLTAVTWNPQNCAVGYYEWNSPYDEDWNQYYTYDWRDATASPFPSSVQTFTFGNNVQTIPNYLCANLNQVASISIPNGVTKIGNSTFSGCSGLSTITLPTNLYYIGNNAFNSCGLTSVLLPESIDTLYDNAFSGCTNLTSVTWNAQNCVVGYIGNDYYYDNNGNRVYYGWREATSSPFPSSVQTFTFGNNVQTIPAYLCYNLNQIASISIPNGVTKIGNGTFYNCTGLASVTMPNSVTRIEAETFRNCTSLASINLSNNLDYIGSSAFYNTGLMSVMIPESLDTIVYDAFNNNSNLSLVIWNARNCANVRTSHETTSSPFPSSVETFIFGDNVQKVPSGLCRDLNQLTSIALPNTVRTIGNSAFSGCSGLISFTMENGVQTIGNSAFSSCSNLPQIVMPNTVTKIGNNAFNSCRNLTTAIVGNSVDTIGGSAFSSCERLISIELPTTVNYIGGSAFYNCTSMNKAIIRSTAELDPYCMLLLNPQIDTIIAPASIFDIDEQHRLNYVCTKRMKYVKANSGELTEDAFVVIRRSASTLETLDVSATSNTTIADEAFSNMYRLIALGLPQGLDCISYKAVAECVRLQSIDIPASITEIGDRAFEDCRSLTTITFGGQSGATADVALQTIGNWAFYNNHALRQIAIPEGVTTIGAGAFYGCTYLEDLAMPASLRNVGDNAFALCNHLTKMQVEATLPPQVAARTFFDVNRAIPVYVPDEAVNDYRTTQVWQEFFIRPISQAATGIGEVEQDGQEGTGMLPDGKFMQNGQLFIRKNGRVYDTQGRLIE